MDETSWADSVGACHIVDEDGVGLWSRIDVDDRLAALAVNAHGAGGEDGSIERVVAKLVCIEA